MGRSLGKPKKFNLRQFITWTLRKASYRWGPRNHAKQRARVGRNQYECAACHRIFKGDEIKSDHVLPVVDPARGWVSWDEYIARMFPVDANGQPDESAFQPLCNECHDKKTNLENQLRRSA